MQTVISEQQNKNSEKRFLSKTAIANTKIILKRCRKIYVEEQCLKKGKMENFFFFFEEKIYS